VPPIGSGGVRRGVGQEATDRGGTSADSAASRPAAAAAAAAAAGGCLAARDGEGLSREREPRLVRSRNHLKMMSSGGAGSAFGQKAVGASNSTGDGIPFAFEEEGEEAVKTANICSAGDGGMHAGRLHTMQAQLLELRRTVSRQSGAFCLP
jgi:hypothetical protein